MAFVGEPAGLAVADVAAAAAAALGRRLWAPVVLSGGSGRSAVLRCQDQDGASVIVKAYPQTAQGAGSFASEAAGLRVASGSGLSPDFLAADPGTLLVVMSDLGTGSSLADVLLTGSANDARAVLLGWARGCGRLSAVGRGRREIFDSLRSQYVAKPPEAGPASHAQLILRTPERIALLGVPVPAGLHAELAEVARVTDSTGPYQVFSPGDICPDNNVLTGDGVKFLDFEDAGFHSAFLDAAYVRMPFSTCWCVFRMPAEVGREAESAYRSEVSALWPELASDAVWQAGLRRAVAAWTLTSMWWLLRRSLEGDAPLEPEAAASPRTRQLMRHRWRVLAGELEPSGELPVLAGLMRSLLAATEGWQAAELPLYPAFR